MQLRARYILFVSVLVLLTILRNGFSLYGLRWKQFQEFQERNDSSFCLRVFCDGPFVVENLEAFGNQFGAPAFFLLYSLFLTTSLFLVLIQISHQVTEMRIRNLAALSLLPAFAIIFQRFGTYDAICFMAILVGLTARSRFIALTAGALFSGTNPEGAFVSGFSTFCLYLVFVWRSKKDLLYFPKNLLIFSLTQVIAAIVLALRDVLERGDRSIVGLILLHDSKHALGQFMAGGSLLIFSWFGSFWFIIFQILNRYEVDLRRHIILIISLTGAVTLIAADGTRNSALGLTSLAVSLLLSSVGQNVVKSLTLKKFLALIFIPSINLANFNVVLPFYQVLYVLDLARPILISH